MGLVQRAVSVMLYGLNSINSTLSSKKNLHFIFLQVFVNLQPLHVCMSFQQTHRILDEISEGHDEEWAEKLSLLIEKPPVHVSE